MSSGLLAAADIAEQADVLASVIGRNADALARARDVITPVRVVRLCGFGSSKHAAGYGAEALDVLAGIPASVLPAPGAAVPGPQPRRDEPLVILSQSGQTPALLSVAERALSADVAVIAVTNAPDSPLERMATVTLQCGAGEERVVAATKSVTAQCLLLRALAADVRGVDVFVDAIRTVVSTGYETSARPAAVIASGFAAEWIADELALKITEMAGFAVTSNSLVEHFHGPKASDEALFAFVDPTDPNIDALATDNVTRIETPATGDATLDAIVRLVAGQCVARALALNLGEDPDAARGLSKVTSTR